MTIRTRIFLVYLLLVGGGAYYVVAWSLDQVRPRYLESMEESLVDAANLLAAAVEAKAVEDGVVRPEMLRQMLDPAYARRLNARIYSIQKTNIDTRIYVTDATGLVVYDSVLGGDEGRDYSRWNDVRFTLAGEYGARGTRTDPENDRTLVIHVAAPIRAENRIVGSLTLGKPTEKVNELVEVAERRIIFAGLGAGALIVLTGFTFSVWLTTPIEKLTAYARDVRDGKPATLPRLAGREVGDLRRAFEEMREALEGKKYVERYTETLTHEIKAPLSAIRGAAELLEEDMPPAERARFLANIRNESARIQHIIDQLLQLSALEARGGLGRVERIELRPLVDQVLASLAPVLRSRRVAVNLTVPEASRLRGEPFLVVLALTNLVKNAAEFSPAGGKISVRCEPQGSATVIVVEDEGPGIPEFARARVFERFYSLPRPQGGAKSTGLGLSFVQEIAHLHGGWARVENHAQGGCRAEIGFP